MRKCILVTAAALVFIVTGNDIFAQKDNQIHVVPTLHRLHSQVSNYSFEDLYSLLEDLNPDVLLVEVTSRDLIIKKEHPVKVEYNTVVFPFARKHNVKMVAMEPSEPAYSRIIKKHARNIQLIDREHPDEVQTFEKFLEVFYGRFSDELITSADDLKNDFFNELCRLKRDFQITIYGDIEREIWEEWNSAFLKKIKEVNSENSGKTIVVLVGFEHYHWLADAFDRENELKFALTQQH